MSKEEIEVAIAALETSIRKLDTWVLVFAALVAIGVLGESVLGIWHWLKDRELRPLRITQSQLHERELEVLRNDTARLSSETETARGEIAKSNERAGVASAEAARANANAAMANQRAAEIMKAAAWRQLSAEQQRRFLTSLAHRSRGKVVLAWIANDPESLGLAVQLSELLTRAQWEIAAGSRTYPTQLVWGVSIPDSVDAADAVLALRAAFNDAQVQFSTADVPPHAMEFGTGGGPGFATVLIGSKRPAFSQPPN